MTSTTTMGYAWAKGYRYIFKYIPRPKLRSQIWLQWVTNRQFPHRDTENFHCSGVYRWAVRASVDSLQDLLSQCWASVGWVLTLVKSSLYKVLGIKGSAAQKKKNPNNHLRFLKVQIKIPFFYNSHFSQLTEKSGDVKTCHHLQTPPWLGAQSTAGAQEPTAPQAGTVKAECFVGCCLAAELQVTTYTTLYFS